MKACLAIAWALPIVVLSARTRLNTDQEGEEVTAHGGDQQSSQADSIDEELRRVDAGVVAHSSELLHRHTKHSMTENEVRSVLAQQPELRDAVSAHLTHLQSEDQSKMDAYMKLEALRMKLRQRAHKGLKVAGLELDKSTGSKTQCRCFVEGAKFTDSKLKLVDLDEEAEDMDDCARSCFGKCGGDRKYKFDPDEARVLGAEIGGISRKVAQCEEQECKCLDATQSKTRIETANRVLTWLNQDKRVAMDVVRLPNPHGGKNSEPNEYDNEKDCLHKCKQNCDDFERGDVELDLEAMCIDEWHD
jgi:hypothetical protein